jgi:polar amino acid transport system substrate-binding protein
MGYSISLFTGGRFNNAHLKALCLGDKDCGSAVRAAIRALAYVLKMRFFSSPIGHRPTLAFNFFLPIALLTIMSLGCAIAFPARSFAAEPLLLVTGPDYPPFTGETLPERGMLTEVVTAAFASQNQPVTIVFEPWKRGYESARIGRYVATFPYVKTPLREEEFLFSAPLYTTRQRLYYSKNTPLTYHSIDDLKGKTTCIPLGYAPSPALRPLIAAALIRIEEPKDLMACARLILAGRADFMIGDELTLDKAIEGAGFSLDQFLQAPHDIATNNHYLLVTKEPLTFGKLVTIFDEQKQTYGQALLELFNRGLAAIRDSGQYQLIISRHLALYRPVISQTPPP